MDKKKEIQLELEFVAWLMLKDQLKSEKNNPSGIVISEGRNEKK